MHTGMQGLFLALALGCGAVPAFAASAADAGMRRAEQRQMMEETGPRAQYNRSVREANAAYAEASRECGRMAGRQRSECMQEAKTNLRNDLAAARSQMNEGSGARR